MAETRDRKPSALQSDRQDDGDSNKDPESKVQAQSPKKKKVRRHRVPKNGNLERLDEESEEETERKNLSSRERRQLSVDEADKEYIPTLNYYSDDKKRVHEVIQDEPEDLDQKVEEVHVEDEDIDDEEPCMTAEEKQALYKAAAIGDIDLLEDCLDKPNSDINMVWYQENLLVAALKAEQEEMAEFLIDNGVDYNFKTTIINVKDERTRNIEWYKCSCRQLAFDRGMHDIVELIDYLNGDLFKFIKPKPRIPRYRRPKPPTPEPSTGGESENDASSEASKDRSEDEGDGRLKKRKRKKRKDSKEEDDEKGKGDAEETNKDVKKEKKKDKGVKVSKDMTDSCDVDSGHHSCESIADAERDEHGKLADSVDGGRTRSKTGFSKGRTGSSRCSNKFTSVSPSPPPAHRSETFMKRFMFLSCPSDEGYGSLSSKSSPTSMDARQKKVRVSITIPPRGTRSSLAMRQACLHRKALAEMDDEMPLFQKKVRIPGSYEAESSRWYGKSKHAKNTLINNELNMPSVTDAKTTVPKRQDAHYMQMTTSAYTKRKLEPNFRKAYSSLDFVVSDRGHKSFQVSKSQNTVYNRQTVDYSKSNIKKSKGNISANFRSHNSVNWKSPSLLSPGSPGYFRTVTKVC